MNDAIVESRAKAATQAAADQEASKLQSDHNLLSHITPYDHISKSPSTSIESASSSTRNTQSRIGKESTILEPVGKLAKDIAEAAANTAKYTKFKTTILNISRSATFDPQEPRKVWCGLCDKGILMDHMFRTDRFKLHIHGNGTKAAACKKAGAKIYSGRITSLFPSVSAPPSISSSSPSLSSLPFRPLSKPLPLPLSTAPQVSSFRPPLTCPGLSSAAHFSIDKYLKRSQSEGGGSPSRAKLYQKILGIEEYKIRQLLPALKRYSTNEQFKMRLLEKQKFTWINHRDILVVRSVGCRKVSEYRDVPCTSCCDLLKNHVFSKALSRRAVPDKNIKYTPISSQNTSVVELLARRYGIVELIDPSGEFSSILKVGRAIASGKIKGSKDLCKMFLEVMDSLGEDIRRDEKGYGKQGKKLSPALYALCENLSILSPKAYRMVAPLLVVQQIVYFSKSNPYSPYCIF